MENSVSNKLKYEFKDLKNNITGKAILNYFRHNNSNIIEKFGPDASSHEFHISRKKYLSNINIEYTYDMSDKDGCYFGNITFNTDEDRLAFIFKWI